MPSPIVTYLDSPVIDMPTFPAPMSIEFSINTAVAASINPFTSEQQIQDWGSQFLEAVVTMPAMRKDSTHALEWLNFLIAARGQASVFTAAYINSQVPSGYTATGYWRMKANANKWSVNLGPVNGMSFEIREAK